MEFRNPIKRMIATFSKSLKRKFEALFEHFLIFLFVFEVIFELICLHQYKDVLPK